MIKESDRMLINTAQSDVLDQALVNIESASESRLSGKLDLAVEQLETAVQSLISVIRTLSKPDPVAGRYGYLHGREPITIELQHPETAKKLSEIDLGFFRATETVVGILLDNYLCGRGGFTFQELCNMTGIYESNLDKMLKSLAKTQMNGYQLAGPSTQGEYSLVKDK
jgi:hypothetical protein